MHQFYVLPSCNLYNPNISEAIYKNINGFVLLSPRAVELLKIRPPQDKSDIQVLKISWKTSAYENVDYDPKIEPFGTPSHVVVYVGWRYKDVLPQGLYHPKDDEPYKSATKYLSMSVKKTKELTAKAMQLIETIDHYYTPSDAFLVMSSVFLETLNIPPGGLLDVEWQDPLYFNTPKNFLSSIELKALSSRDYHLMETYATELEVKLLEQHAVLFQGQIVPIFLTKDTNTVDAISSNDKSDNQEISPFMTRSFHISGILIVYLQVTHLTHLHNNTTTNLINQYQLTQPVITSSLPFGCLHLSTEIHVSCILSSATSRFSQNHVKNQNAFSSTALVIIPYPWIRQQHNDFDILAPLSISSLTTTELLSTFQHNIFTNNVLLPGYPIAYMNTLDFLELKFAASNSIQLTDKTISYILSHNNNTALLQSDLIGHNDDDDNDKVPIMIGWFSLLNKHNDALSHLYPMVINIISHPSIPYGCLSLPPDFLRVVSQFSNTPYCLVQPIDVARSVIVPKITFIPLIDDYISEDTIDSFTDKHNAFQKLLISFLSQHYNKHQNALFSHGSLIFIDNEQNSDFNLHKNKEQISLLNNHNKTLLENDAPQHQTENFNNDETILFNDSITHLREYKRSNSLTINGAAVNNNNQRYFDKIPFLILLSDNNENNIFSHKCQNLSALPPFTQCPIKCLESLIHNHQIIVQRCNEKYAEYHPLLRFLNKRLHFPKASPFLPQTLENLLNQYNFGLSVLKVFPQLHDYNSSFFKTDFPKAFLQRSCEEIFLGSHGLNPQGTLIIGKRRSGRSTLAKFFADVASQYFHQKVFFLQCAPLVTTERFESGINLFKEIVNQVIMSRPSIIILDDLDILCPSDDNSPSFDISQSGQNESSTIWSTSILDLLTPLNIYRYCSNCIPLKKESIVTSDIVPACQVIATISSLNAMNSILRTNSLFQHYIRTDEFDAQQIGHIGDSIFQRRFHEEFELNPEKKYQYIKLSSINNIIESLPNLNHNIIGDVHNIVESILHYIFGNTIMDENEESINKNILNYLQTTLSNSYIHQQLTEHQDEKFQYLSGGLTMVQQTLKDLISLRMTYIYLCTEAPLQLPQGALLIGPPGCGKTFVAQSLAKLCNINFKCIKGPEIMSKYIGGSEEAIRQVFEEAQSMSPCLLFFDEIDAIALKRGSEVTGVTDRVVNQMLCYLDGFEERENVFVLAATSKPEFIDTALLRPGRFDKILYCGLPTLEERIDIFKKYLKSSEPWITDIVIHNLPPGTNGADIYGIITTAYVHSSNGATLKKQDIDKAVNEFYPSLSKDLIKKYHLIYRQYVNPHDMGKIDNIEKELDIDEKNQNNFKKNKKIIETHTKKYLHSSIQSSSSSSSSPHGSVTRVALA